MIETAIRAAFARPTLSSLCRMLRGLFAAVARSMARRATRQALAELEPHLLEDIGRTAEEARREASRPFWR